jgi:hypothetical protein
MPVGTSWKSSWAGSIHRGRLCGPVPQAAKAFSIVPNPAVAKTRILFPQGAGCKDLRISLYSSTGVIQHAVIYDPDPEIDVTGLKPGIYLVNVSGCGFSGTQKLVTLSP